MGLRRVDYDERQYEVYASGRALAAETIDTWMDAFVRHVRDHRPLRVLDLGSGTGRFTPALADTFGGPVFGVEPAGQMRRLAEQRASHPRVTYVAGSAEQIPLPDDSCDVALLHLSLHHFQDRDAAARELARVLRPAREGQVLVRSTFGDRVPELQWHRYFRRARAIEAEVFPALDEVVATFAAVGLHPVALTTVRHRFAPSLTAYAERLRLRAISIFEHLDETEIADGFAALERDVANERRPEPVEEDCELLVLGCDRP